ncbi:penicillin-binding transpeptidase domain-containing protein, partial [Mordavella massiliensis]|uniref:penicillin-binding transpeptidase domain-containing protein n=1 Tax=Mordavella massiliensis TaxID=1871024 RepID=UPI003709666B
MTIAAADIHQPCVPIVDAPFLDRPPARNYRLAIPKIGHPVSQATAKKVLHYMQGVIYNKNGTGQVYKISGYRIAGKTGTAQIGSSHGYETGSTNYLYSFVEMAPAK